MRINHNIASLNTYRQLSTNTGATSKSLEKLSSGLRINRAGDDAAGLAISEKMRAQVRGLDQAGRNGQDGISLIQTAEGALNETHSILQRMRELAVQSATDTNTSDDRDKIQSEVDQLAKEITRISNTTEFNTKNLLAGGLSSTFHIGANADQNMTLAISGMDAYSLGIAGSTATSSNFAAGGTGITGISSVGRGMATGVSYDIDVVKTAASLTAAVAEGVNAGGHDAAAVVTDVTTYTGATSKSFTVKVLTTDVGGDEVTGAAYSTDGGSSYTLASVVDGVGSSVVTLSDGLTFTVTDGTNSNLAADDTWTFTVAPSTTTLQLQDPSDVNIGNAVTVNYNNSTAIVGNAATNETATITFTYSGLTSNTATFDVIASSSTAATTVAGEVTVEADTKAGLAVNTQTVANSAITAIDDAIKSVSEERSKLGAVQNRLEHTIANLGTSSENLTAAESRVRDVDMAKEMMEFTKNNILSQAAQAMLAQANQQPQGVLQLLR